MARILIAVDGSPPSQRALEFGASLAAKLGEGVVLLHVRPQAAPEAGGGPGTRSEPRASHPGELTPLLEALADKARSHGVAVETELRVGDPALAIHDRAQLADVRMVVMGSRGQGTVARLLLGSVATQVVHTSSRPVVVVR
ncbi:universal stress protein [Archangium sp.]|jgi:nucleotide-binding universal stress UspA family protein|uniref:universal stress protein n=1 Tax=Archangium sp. TaxID=1872627 RepID=UPI002ED7897E